MTTLHQLQPPDAVGRLPVVLLEPGEEAHQLVQLSIRLNRAHGVHLKTRKIILRNMKFSCSHGVAWLNGSPTHTATRAANTGSIPTSLIIS